MAKKKPVTIGEMRRKQRSRAAKSKLEMGPAKMDTSHISPMRQREKKSLMRLHKTVGKPLTDEEFDREYDDPGNLGQARAEKIREMQDRLKSPLFEKRLADQGIHYDQEVLDRVSRGIETTPVRLSYMGGFAPKGAYNPRPGRRSVRLDTLAKQQYGEDVIKRTLRHELEHDGDERFEAVAGKSLANEQVGILKKLGAIPGKEGHDHEKTDKEALYSPGHVRIGIMAIRDELGKEFVTRDDLLELLGTPGPRGEDASFAWKNRDSVQYLKRMIATGKSFKEIADLMNQVATRQKVAARASKEWA